MEAHQPWVTENPVHLFVEHLEIPKDDAKYDGKRSCRQAEAHEVEVVPEPTFKLKHALYNQVCSEKKLRSEHKSKPALALQLHLVGLLDKNKRYGDCDARILTNVKGVLHHEHMQSQKLAIVDRGWKRAPVVVDVSCQDHVELLCRVEQRLNEHQKQLQANAD